MKNSKVSQHIILALFFLNLSCQSIIRTADRPELNSTQRTIKTERESFKNTDQNNLNSSSDTITLSDQDLEKYAYELGFDPIKGLTSSERELVLKRKKLRALERTLDSKNERLNYSKVVPLLNSDQEKIDYLSIPSIEGRKAWINRNKIWSRDKVNPDYEAVVTKQDLALGMSQDLVRQSWGEPNSVEVSGNPIYKNERWKYIKEKPTLNGYKRERRYVYFEGGRVVGWETDN